MAGLYGVQPSYDDITQKRVHSSPEAMLAALKVLGTPIEKISGAAEACAQRQSQLAQRLTEPVHVSWDHKALTFEVQLPDGSAHEHISVEMTLESGERRESSAHTSELHTVGTLMAGPQRFVKKQLIFPGRLPFGYHRLELHTGAGDAEAMVVAAPSKGYDELPDGERHGLGVFLPLYALRSHRNWGAGDFTDLKGLCSWGKEQGANVVGTLPLLATFLDKPFDPSPYAPVSRLCWNELYIDIESLPEFRECDEARRLAESSGILREIQALRRANLVDYRRAMALKRRVLEALAAWTWSGRGAKELEQFLETNGDVKRYAAFRATVEHYSDGWPAWPKGAVGPYDKKGRDYHCYVQWAAHRQLTEVSCRGAGLYLDLPIGVHSGGYDTWAHREAFALGMSVGAPPDPYIETGQDWGFPPLHPERIRQQGYGYPIAYLRKHMQVARALRVDHVMGLHRLFWVPRGLKPTDGVYVTYKPEEWYAILSVESHRNKCWVIGENLGIVPPQVNAALKRHRLGSMHMLQFSIRPHPETALGDVPTGSVASLNNHDMPPFAAFWSGEDFRWRSRLGILMPKTERSERKARKAHVKALTTYLRKAGLLREKVETEPVLEALHGFLAESRAKLMLVNLEDLWGETRPQNVPGTGAPQPNWRRKTRPAFEEFSQMPDVAESLKELAKVRRGKRL